MPNGEIKYGAVNKGHSVGQEIEYCLVKEGEILMGWDLECIAAKIEVESDLLCQGKNSAKVYDDNMQLELCSSPQPTIRELYTQMKGMYKIMMFLAEKERFEVVKGAYCDKPTPSGYKDRPQIASSHVHVGAPSFKKSLLKALVPYLPMFIALSNNSPTEEFPKGSQRLRLKRFSNILDLSKPKLKNKRKIRVKRAIWNHDIAPTVEVRCLDRGKIIEEDIANAAFVFATAEKIKEDMGLGIISKPMEKSFEKLYSNGEEIGEYCLDGMCLHLCYPPERNSLVPVIRRMMTDATCLGFDTCVKINGGKPKLLGEIAQKHYKDISEKLLEIDTPQEIMAVLEEKLGDRNGFNSTDNVVNIKCKPKVKGNIDEFYFYPRNVEFR